MTVAIDHVCRFCGCTDDDCRQCVAVTGEPCRWVLPDVCSRCADERGCRLRCTGEGWQMVDYDGTILGEAV